MPSGKTTRNAEIQRLLGVHGEFGQKLGLSNDWAYHIIKLVGNYNDLWERNFTPLGREAGVECKLEGRRPAFGIAVQVTGSRE